MANEEQSASIYLSDTPVVITKNLIEEFLDSLKISGRQALTIRFYERYLKELYDFLPQGKELTPESVGAWIGSLRAGGFSANTINAKATALNGLLRYCAAEALHVPFERTQEEKDPPGLAHPELLDLLSAAGRMGREREYLLIRVLSGMGLNAGELDRVTVESVRCGVIRLPRGQERLVPPSLKSELLFYADHRGIKQGPLFVTRTGRPLDRSNITKAIRLLAKEAGLEPERCNPRALKRMCRTSQKELMENLQIFWLQPHDELPGTEREAQTE